jgi:RNA polymerase sigma-70 factor (ECF subfamily)
LDVAACLQNRPSEAAMHGDDGQLVNEARSGNQDAFRRLMERHQKRAFRVALGVVGNADDAREVCQEAFIRVHNNLSSFDERARFTTWLHRIVVNQAIDLLRRRRRLVLLDDAIIGVIDQRTDLVKSAALIDPDRALEGRELAGQLRRALDGLTPAHRAILILREVEELSYEEIAAALGIPIGTVMSRLFHARKRMQRLLTAEEPALARAA